jgi:hypothetical protein
MAITFNIQADLEATEKEIVDWKNLVRDYKRNETPVPKLVADHLKMLKEDAAMLRRQLNGENR